MSISMFEASVPVFTRFLRNLAYLLDIAEAHVNSKKLNPMVLLGARLHPNMYEFSRQVGEAIRHAVTACALLSRVDPPAFRNEEASIIVLKEQIDEAVNFLERLRPDQINGTENNEVAFKFKNGAQRWFAGQSLLLTFSLPNFFFHVTTAYDILRHCGVNLVKQDFLGRVSRVD
jgi:hypothetical protein